MKRNNVVIIIVAIIVLSIGIISGFFIGKSKFDKSEYYESVISQIEESYENRVEEEMETETSEVESELSSEPESSTSIQDYVYEQDIMIGDSMDKYTDKYTGRIDLTDDDRSRIIDFFSPLATYPYTGDVDTLLSFKEVLTDNSKANIDALISKLDTSVSKNNIVYDYDHLLAYANPTTDGAIVLDLVFTGKDPSSQLEAEDWIYKKEMNIRARVVEGESVEIFRITLEQ